MKKAYILLISILAFTAFSCREWMNVDPAGTQTTNSYWTSKTDVEAVLGSAYQALRSCLSDGSSPIVYWGEMRGNGLTMTDGAANNARSGNLTPSNSHCDWRLLYTLIGRANSVIKYAPTVVEKDASFYESEMLSTVGEAHFLRALAYFYLVRTFKDVPYLTEPYVTDDAEFMLPQTDGNAILRAEIAALTQYLPSAKVFFTDPVDNKGRVTRWAMYTLIADMNLWLSASDHTGNTDGYLRACIEACDEVIDSHYIALIGTLGSDQDWFYNFYPGNSNESIFEVQFSSVLSGEGNGFHSRFYGQYRNGTIPSWAFTTSYTTLGRFMTQADDSDLRGEGATFGKLDPANDDRNNMYSIWKYIGKTPDTERVSDDNSMNDQNWIIYRMAEVYLMKAEALAMQGFTDEALVNLNKVRERGGSLPRESAQYGDEYSVILAILYERDLEFVAEAKNWFDMLRIGLRYNKDSRYRDLLVSEMTSGLTATEKLLVQSKMSNVNWWYLPVSSSELEANTALVQNPAFANFGK